MSAIIIRLVIVLVLYGAALFLIRRSKAANKKFLAVFAVLAVCVAFAVSVLFPFENLIVAFDTPEKALQYMSFQKTDLELTVEGEHTTLTVERTDAVSRHPSILPKTENGWKLATNYDSRRIFHESFLENDLLHVCVYQYKRTGEYYIEIHSAGDIPDLADSLGSVFYPIEVMFHVEDQSWYTVLYYAYIPGFDGQYWVEANGERITLNGEG